MTRLSLSVLLALALTACSTTPRTADTQRPAPVVDAPSGPGAGSSAPAAAASTATTGSGGYLAGDGPGAGTTVNLDAIPDAVPKAEPLHRYANRPYSALGKTYTPLTETGKYKSRGVASWYGKKFHGQRTSIGEVYDMYGMTAAHPTLPIPSYARVTNVANGKSVVVRVNDRGPFLHDRIMDLSYAAAWKLGYVNQGSAEVEVESIAVKGNAPALGAVTPRAVKVQPIAPVGAAGKVYLQLGAFKSAQGAASFLEKMRATLGESDKGYALHRKGGLTRVHFGPFANTEEARVAATRLADRLGFKPFVSLH